jgi:hypothetical protein
MAASSNHPVPFIGGFEEDYLTDSRHFYNRGPGVTKYAKRCYNKRARRYRKFLIREQLD